MDNISTFSAAVEDNDYQTDILTPRLSMSELKRTLRRMVSIILIWKQWGCDVLKESEPKRKIQIKLIIKLCELHINYSDKISKYPLIETLIYY